MLDYFLDCFAYGSPCRGVMGAWNGAQSRSSAPVLRAMKGRTGYGFVRVSRHGEGFARSNPGKLKPENPAAAINWPIKSIP